MDLTDPIFERRDATIDFNWANGSPDATIDSDSFSVRWTGSLTPQFSETYTFTATTDDGVRLWVNGQQIIDHWENQGPTPRTGTIALVAGTSYNVKMEYFENSGGAEAHLQWSSASTPIGVIPATQITAPTPSPVTPDGGGSTPTPPSGGGGGGSGSPSSSGGAGGGCGVGSGLGSAFALLMLFIAQLNGARLVARKSNRE